MLVFVTGGSGVLGRVLVPGLRNVGHQVRAPASAELDLCDPGAVSSALAGVGAVFHLATRIPPPEQFTRPDAWTGNDRLRTEATRVLVDTALAAGVRRFVQPTVTFVYPAGRADENTPVGAVAPHLRSALDAEREVARFTSAGRDGVVLRLGLLYGPGARTQQPNPDYGATLHVADAAAALAAALEAPAGLYNVLDDAPQVSNAAYTAAAGWRPSPRPT